MRGLGIPRDLGFARNTLEHLTLLKACIPSHDDTAFIALVRRHPMRQERRENNKLPDLWAPLDICGKHRAAKPLLQRNDIAIVEKLDHPSLQRIFIRLLYVVRAAHIRANMTVWRVVMALTIPICPPIHANGVVLKCNGDTAFSQEFKCGAGTGHFECLDQRVFYLEEIPVIAPTTSAATTRCRAMFSMACGLCAPGYGKRHHRAGCPA